jgi:predicted RNase H-like HicB family nuclease
MRTSKILSLSLPPTLLREAERVQTKCPPGENPGLNDSFLRRERPNMRQIKIIVEKHTDGYVAYPLGVKGIVVGQGDTYEEVLADVKSAIRFHVESFGEEALAVE